MDLARPKLFLLTLPFTDETGKSWFCSHCAMLEGALGVNPHWEASIEVRRIDHEKPRREVVELLGEENQWLPVLVIGNGRTITEPVKIATWLAEQYGGAAPHP